MSKDDKHYDEARKKSSYTLGRDDGRASMKLDVLYLMRSFTGRDFTLAKLVKDIEDLS